MNMAYMNMTEAMNDPACVHVWYVLFDIISHQNLAYVVLTRLCLQEFGLSIIFCCIYRVVLRFGWTHWSKLLTKQIY